MLAVETVNSMIKRLMGEVVNARSYWRRSRLLLLKTLTHNISLLARWIGFLLSRLIPFSDSRQLRRIPARPPISSFGHGSLCTSLNCS